MKGAPIRALHVLRVMNRAGIETWLMHLLRHFDRSEIALDFLVSENQPGAYDDEIRALGGRILYCPQPRRPWLYARNFVRVLREYGPYDVVHSHNYFFSGLDLRLATVAGAGKRIAHLHPVRDLESGRNFRSLYRRLMGRWIRRYSDLLLAPSQASLEAFSRFADISAKPQAVIRNCIESGQRSASPMERIQVRRELGLPVDCPVIAYVARFEPHKNHLMLAELAEELERRGVRAHFVAAGTEGSSRGTFEQRIAGRNDFSVFVDRPDLKPLLACADIFFFPSREEGFGTVAIEASAAGLPVVAAELPGIREACCPGQRAFMFAEGDVESAAKSVRSILADNALAVRLSAEGRDWARQFSVESVANQLREIYGADRKAALA